MRTLHQHSRCFSRLRSFRILFVTSDRSFLIICVREVQNVLYRKACLCVGQRHVLGRWVQLLRKSCCTTKTIRCLKGRKAQQHKRGTVVGGKPSGVSARSTVKATHGARWTSIAWNNWEISFVSPGKAQTRLRDYSCVMDIALHQGVRGK